MSRSELPVISCDHEDGCDEWEIDWYSTGASVPKLPTGWTGEPHDARCPQHSGANDAPA